MNYSNFVEINERFLPIESTTTVSKLAPGVYDLGYDQRSDQVYFTKSKITSDSLLDIPSPEYTSVTNEIDFFLRPETRAQYAKYGYLYKRSTLLHGLPGTGKTCIVNRIAQKVVASGGIVLFNPHLQVLRKIYKVLDSIQPDTLVMTIFEELDTQLENYDEEDFLVLLDGEVQKENVVYVATTNHIDKIPARMRRPGRFSTVLEVNYPTVEGRKFYLRSKGVDAGLVDTWADATDELSIDELKETVLAVYCLGQSLDNVVARIRDNRGLPEREVSGMPWAAEY